MIDNSYRVVKIYDKPFNAEMRHTLKHIRNEYRRGRIITHKTLKEIEYYNTIFTHLIHNNDEIFLNSIVRLINSDGSLNWMHIPLRYFVGKYYVGESIAKRNSIRLQVILHIYRMFKLMTAMGQRRNHNRYMLIFLVKLQEEWDHINISNKDLLSPSYIAGLIDRTIPFPTQYHKMTEVVNKDHTFEIVKIMPIKKRTRK